MVSQRVQVLGNEEYFCLGTPERKRLDDSLVNKKTWACICCDEPVLIEAIDEKGKNEAYVRLSVKLVEKEDYVYIPRSGFLRVLDAGKGENGYYLAIERYRKLTNLSEEHLCLILPSGRFFSIDT